LVGVFIRRVISRRVRRFEEHDCSLLIYFSQGWWGLTLEIDPPILERS